MTLRCAAHEVAIYVPPEGSTKLSASDALERCRAFLTDLLGSTPSDVAIYDDRDAELRVTSEAFHDKVEGRTPAFAALAMEAGRDKLRVVLVADERALHRLPGGAMAVQRLEDQLQIVEAALALSRRPDPATLTALHEGQGAAWASYLEPLAFRRMKAPRGRPSRVLAPAPLVAAFLERDTIEGWCRIAANAARSALPTRGAQLCAQAARNFETWLRDSVEELPAAGPGGPHGDAESRSRERISEARRAIEEGRWEDALAGAQAAAELGRDLPEEVQGAPASSSGAGATRTAASRGPRRPHTPPWSRGALSPPGP